jgi:hypothetical protein
MAVRQAWEYGFCKLTTQCIQMHRRHVSENRNSDSLLSQIIQLTPGLMAQRGRVQEVAPLFQDLRPLIVSQFIDARELNADSKGRPAFIEDDSDQNESQIG